MLSLGDLAALHQEFGSLLSAPIRGFKLGEIEMGGDAPQRLMGVVNLSADSWYRESVCLNTEAAIRRGLTLSSQGAAIIDVGAESSLAHAERVDDVLQQSRLLPVIRGIASAGIPVSAETYHPAVARACLEAGAQVLNLTGTVQTQEMFDLVAAHNAGVIICYVQGSNVREVGDLTLPDDPIPMLEDYFGGKIQEATRAGVGKIWIDPGLGFYYRNLQDSSVRVRYQMKMFLHTFRLRSLGWPICHALPHAFECFEEEVRIAEAFFAVLALLGSTDLLRTHEVPKVRGVLQALQNYY